MLEFLLALLAFGCPWAFKKLTLPSWISVVLLCYALGLTISALLGPPKLMDEIVHILIQACVVIAIPSMLLAGSWSAVKRLGLSGLKAAASLWIGAACASFFLLSCTETGASKIGMIIAIFTGGLANLQAAGLILGLDEVDLIAANLGDVLAGGLMFICLTSFGWPLLRTLFGLSSKAEMAIPVSKSSLVVDSISVENCSIRNYTSAFFITIVCIALAAGLSQFFPSQYLELSVLSIGAILALSFGERLDTQTSQHPVATAGQYLGEYLMLVFCVLIGWSADWTAVGSEALIWAGQMGLFLFIQVSVSLVLAKAFRLEPALYLMALIGSIYSPAFVPPIASTTKRYDLVPAGVLIGLVGLALGTLIGVLFARAFA